MVDFFNTGVVLKEPHPNRFAMVQKTVYVFSESLLAFPPFTRSSTHTSIEKVFYDGKIEIP